MPKAIKDVKRNKNIKKKVNSKHVKTQQKLRQDNVKMTKMRKTRVTDGSHAVKSAATSGSTNQPPQPEPNRQEVRKKRQVNICTTSCCYDVVRRIATEFSLVENADQWHVYWTDMFISAEKYMGMKVFQRINHFPGMVEICRKDLLAKKLVSMSNRFPNDFNFFPKTWCLPNELIQAMNYSKLYTNKLFIVKPCYGSKGRGIQVIQNLKMIKNLDRMICQVYIHRPFLIDGYKVDFRVYALLTSFEPLRLYVYNEGIARFATRKYEDPNESNFSDRFMHLTNYSVNRRNSLFNADGDEGSKRKLSTVNQWLKNHGCDTTHIWDSIDDSIIKTILMVVPTLKYCYKICFPNHQISQQACFEVLGFDFILSRHLKPYLLEVNHSPSFYCHTPVDYEVKEALLRDTFTLLDLGQNNAKMPDNVKIADKILKIYAKKKIQSLEQKREQDILKARIDWENSHLGNYRLVYPNNNMDKYKAFLSKYKRTQMSKARCRFLNESVMGSTYNSVRKNPYPFSQDNQDSSKGESRAMRILLLQSHCLMNNVYNDIKTADQERFMEEIDLSRRNEWDLEKKFSEQYVVQREKFTQRVSGALQCISQKSGLRKPEKELLSSLLLNPPLMAKRRDEERYSHLGPLVRPPDSVKVKTINSRQ